MAKQIRAARHYQERSDPLRRIADRAIPGIKGDLKDSLKGLSGLIPQSADSPAAIGDWHAVKNAIDWGHFREVLKATFGQIGKAREAGAQHGAKKINAAFASAGRKVRFRKAGPPDEPRDERGRWTDGGGGVDSWTEGIWSAEIDHLVAGAMEGVGGLNRAASREDLNRIHGFGRLVSQYLFAAEHKLVGSARLDPYLPHLRRAAEAGRRIAATTSIEEARTAAKDLSHHVRELAKLRHIDVEKAYNPDEPRDERGRWTTGGSTEHNLGADHEVGEALRQFKTLREAYGNLSRHDQASLGPFIQAISGAAGKRELSISGDGRIMQGRSDLKPHAEPRFGSNEFAIRETAWLEADEAIGRALRKIPELSGVKDRLGPGARSSLVEAINAIEAAGRKRGFVRKVVRKDVNDQFAFDLYSQEVQDELRRAQDDLIAELEQDARDAIDQIVLSGARLGLAPDEIMDDIREMIGLTARQSQAAMNYRDMLESLDPGALQRQLRNFLEDDNVQAALDAGQPMDEAMVDKLTNDYIDNYLDYRAETIAQTEATRAVSLGLQDAYSQAIDRGVFPSDAVKQFWKIDLDELTCPICISIPDMNPDGVAIDEAFDSIDGPQDAPPAPHPSCLPGNMMVSASSIFAVSKRFYDGPLVIVRTAKGKQLSCTPNHPILTPHGWVAAHLLDIGSDIVCARFVRSIRIGLKNYDELVPSRIEEIVDAFGKARNVSSMPVPVSAPDFHGDGVGSKVAIVWSNRLLRNGHDTSFFEQKGKFRFRWGTTFSFGHVCLSRLNALLQRSLATTRRLVRGFGARLAFVISHSGRFDDLGIAVASNGNFVFAQHSQNNGPRELELSAQFIGRSPSAISFDQIVDIGCVDFAGHVFNLQTDSGWYEAEGIITHNCRCSIEIVTDLDMLPADSVDDSEAA
jgi:hypothetical protein